MGLIFFTWSTEVVWSLKHFSGLGEKADGA